MSEVLSESNNAQSQSEFDLFTQQFSWILTKERWNNTLCASYQSGAFKAKGRLLSPFCCQQASYNKCLNVQRKLLMCKSFELVIFISMFFENTNSINRKNVVCACQFACIITFYAY